MELNSESTVLQENALATGGSAAFPGTWHTDDWKVHHRGDQPSGLGRPQTLCILTLAPLPILAINKYAFDHGQQDRCFASHLGMILDNATSDPKVNSIDAIGNLDLALAPHLRQLGVPHEFFEPSSNMFVAASLLLAGMLTSVPHHVMDHYPNLRQRIVLGNILAAILLGLTLKMSFVATFMYLIPWAAYSGTVISESVFACL
ncbi:hypothetical protein M409DRAFT_29218 [Zasmidium cellare ATCC 36951]|uniref:Uncharacterized protein n=1 Tax=Zasmidium cellare ATCC 36951 TaxID=1080233 RepID=A0A6A6C3P3_ZASCE|nr:uncharacterized protein M409DRAFT_29218 [Zasmidium cellare ATCC 36951]KAF2160369.1 hypothetical protein M409DRAFT_29218 [Zasmidium cellare ATCC 36951]